VKDPSAASSALANEQVGSTKKNDMDDDANRRKIFQRAEQMFFDLEKKKRIDVAKKYMKKLQELITKVGTTSKKNDDDGTASLPPPSDSDLLPHPTPRPEKVLAIKGSASSRLKNSFNNKDQEEQVHQNNDGDNDNLYSPRHKIIAETQRYSGSDLRTTIFVERWS